MKRAPQLKWANTETTEYSPLTDIERVERCCAAGRECFQLYDDRSSHRMMSSSVLHVDDRCASQMSILLANRNRRHGNLLKWMMIIEIGH